MRIHPLPAILLAAFALPAQDLTNSADGPKLALARFQAAHEGPWAVQWHAATGTPSAIYGPGLPIADWRENSLDEARRHAVLLLAEQSELLGIGELGPDASEFREVIGARMGRTWSLVFDQYYRGLPVIEGRADVRINMLGRVAMFGSRAFAIPANFDVTPAIGEDVATALAWEAMREAPVNGRQPVPPAQPRLVIWGDIAAAQQAPVHLAWEVSVSNIGAGGSGRIGRWYVDAKTGGVLHFTNDKHECGIAGCAKHPHPAMPLPAPVLTTVTVMAWTRTGNDAFNPLVNTPLRGVNINVPGIGLVTTDQNGQFVINIAAPVTISTTSFDGAHFNAIAGGSAPTASVLVNPGVAATLQLSSSGASTDEAAHSATAHWVDKTNEWVRTILGNTSQMSTISNIAPTVNINDTCNAYYSGNTINFFLAGGGCSNTAFSTVIAHEWGHGLDDRYGGVSNSTGDGLSEGWGDILGMYLVDSNLLGSGFTSPGQPLRNGINGVTYPTTGLGVHTAGQCWMGFAWELRTRLRNALGTTQAVAISDDIVIGSIVADATNQTNAVLEVFIADDDDGNLNNGTPHYTQLSGAALAKNLPYPEQILATIGHSPLLSTAQRLTPREVLAGVTPVGGATISQVRLHYNAGAGNFIRNMHPQGLPTLYRALLPGLMSGTVNYHFEVLTGSGETVRHPDTGEFSYVVDAGLTSPFLGFWSDGFETGAPGWTSAQVLQQNDWQVGDPAGKSGTSAGVAWADPQTAATGVNCYGNDLGNTIGTQTWNGSYAANVENYLRSPIIDCTGRTDVRLRFKRWLSVEQAPFDLATLSVNGQIVWQNASPAHHVDTSWQTVEYALPMATNNPSVQIEWRMKSDSGMHLGGWNIDDVELGTRVTPPLDAELTWQPEQVVQGGAIFLRIETAGPFLPYVLAIADLPGPLVIPGFPTFQLGGTITTFGGATDAGSQAWYLFNAPNVSAATGMVMYSQVLTVDAAITQWVVSNPFITFVTQTP